MHSSQLYWLRSLAPWSGLCLALQTVARPLVPSMMTTTRMRRRMTMMLIMTASLVRVAMVGHANGGASTRDNQD